VKVPGLYCFFLEGAVQLVVSQIGAGQQQEPEKVALVSLNWLPLRLWLFLLESVEVRGSCIL
jgi:hypothetical protein